MATQLATRRLTLLFGKTQKGARLRPRTLLLLLAGLVAVAYATVGASYLRERSARDALSAQLDAARTTIATADDVLQSSEELTARLEAAEQELADAQQAFPSTLDGNAILETILNNAESSGVLIRQITVRQPAAAREQSSEETDTASYTVLGFDIEVEGTFEQIVSFLAAIEDASANTSKVGAFSLQESDGRYALTLEILNYARGATGPGPSLDTPDGSSGQAVDAASGGDAATSEVGQ